MTDEVSLSEAITKIYVHKQSSLIGESLDEIKTRFGLEIQNLGPLSDNRLIESSCFRIGGTAEKMETFLQQYF